ncbi:endomucin [Apteryx rowi]|uniref:endomucin n=1 Tax=Apteryx rowi TaxID=308060 RepID=UPI000E1C494D|nr:endomucin [Apteryx rowi]
MSQNKPRDKENDTTGTTTKASSTILTSTSATQANETQSAQNRTLGDSSTKGPSLPPTTVLQKATSAPETSSLPVSSTAEPTNFGSPGSSSGNEKLPEDTIHYSSVILPIVITLIVITLSVFSLVALYRMCQKKTPERQENGTEQAQSDKEGVKLLSVKTTSVETGEHSSQGKNKTRQRDDSSSHVSNKYTCVAFRAYNDSLEELQELGKTVAKWHF